MKAYLIGYDLNKSDKDYSSLIEKIKSLGTWWHCLDSTWIIKTNLNASQIRDILGALIDSNDELLVVHLSGESAWKGFDSQCSSWLLQHLNNR